MLTPQVINRRLISDCTVYSKAGTKYLSTWQSKSEGFPKINRVSVKLKNMNELISPVCSDRAFRERQTQGFWRYGSVKRIYLQLNVETRLD